MEVGAGLVGTAGATDVGADVVVVADGVKDGLKVGGNKEGVAVGNRVGMIASTTLILTMLSTEMFKT